MLDPNFDNSYVDTMSTNLSKNTHIPSILFLTSNIYYSLSVIVNYLKCQQEEIGQTNY